MDDTELAEDHDFFEDLWTLFTKIKELAIAIKWIVVEVVDDFRLLIDLARDSPSHLQAFLKFWLYLLFFWTECSIFTTVTIVVCTIFWICSMALAAYFVAGLRSTRTEPAAGKMLGHRDHF
jgi:hypothetical protein